MEYRSNGLGYLVFIAFAFTIYSFALIASAVQYGSSFGWWWILWAVLLLFCLLITVSFWMGISEEIVKPPFPKEIATEQQELENWLFSEGYQRFLGTAIYTDPIKTVSFKIGDETPATFLKPDKELEHGNYSYADVGNYRIVKFHGKYPRYYVKK